MYDIIINKVNRIVAGKSPKGITRGKSGLHKSNDAR